ncbi:SURF1 family protein [Rhodovarius crocodyli]|uniref:SURF1 family protein n=1 Tax=Rhodovarius crocodyli TaxID=1979269 RepID=UPI0023EA738D|nr:SURF1 family protein [Rhodovarius crocodyli]
MLLAAALFTWLGTWQIERRAWKHALIDQVEFGLRTAPVQAFGPGNWDHVDRRDAYRRLTVTGEFLHDRETLVRATTELGSGYWVITPLRTPAFTVLVNRGFVDPAHRDPATRPAPGGATVIGLLRLSEPGGGFLRSNNPADNLWYSRDVPAIAAARGLGQVAPYFIDSEARDQAGYPVGGLTVIRFADNHLVYALTWFGMAVLSLVGFGLVLRRAP